ncbi:hypothetical protein [Allofournierella sp.]|uniref:hypothetical protein n=1 Tax=Allofournierella sp. TaxID=1940256 RepID=UPI002E76C29F|nr:hypothetical protein [Fournierella sp.]MEE0757231.1 hypothetical protein [Fournierella sp.]
MQKNGFLTLCFSFIPGAGQMYQGYMKRGVTQVLLFVIPLMIGGVFLPVLMVLSAVVYMYSFFDSLNLRAQLRQGAAPADAFLFSWDGGEDLARLVERRHHLIGWALVVLGVAGLYQGFVSPWLYRLVGLIGWDTALGQLLNQVVRGIPGLAVGLVFIGLGLWLIKGGKKKQPAEPDYTEFKGEGEV